MQQTLSTPAPILLTSCLLPCRKTCEVWGIRNSRQILQGRDTVLGIGPSCIKRFFSEPVSSDRFRVHSSPSNSSPFSSSSIDDDVDIQVKNNSNGDYVPVEFTTSTTLSSPKRAKPFVSEDEDFAEELGENVDVKKASSSEDDAPSMGPGPGTIWGLTILSLAYLHHSTSGFALPALLPIITEDLKLADQQGALLTAGYTVLYALALVPMGLLADRVDRPRLLSLGIALWSGLTIAASSARGFGDLLAARIGFAAAQATQNPICFSLIPELFPKGKTTAMALYNSAIYVGRALSFAALLIAGKLGVPEGFIGGALDIGYTLVPLDKVDLSLVSILYTQGDYAAVSPIYTYAAADGSETAALQMESAFAAWRQLLAWLGPPGLIIAALCLFTVDEPREAGKGFLGDPLKSSKFLAVAEQNRSKKQINVRKTGKGLNSIAKGSKPLSKGREPEAEILSTSDVAIAPGLSKSIIGPVSAMVDEAKDNEPVNQPIAPTDSLQDSVSKLKELLESKPFLALTGAAAFNDIGSWALVAWQATFYQRVYELTPETYAPLLATVIPVGGIIGGVGAGLLGDWLQRIGGRGWITIGANMVAAPMIGFSLLAPDYKQSFAALMVGFALSEAWRAPAAVAIRDISPPGLGSSGSAVHLCIRNLLGGLGPIAVAFLAGKFGLQIAMLLVPGCYLLSGCGFVVTELVVADEARRKRGA